MAKRRPRANTSPLDDIGAALGSFDDVPAAEAAGLRVDYLLIDLLRPDPVQPRRVLPESVHIRFHAQEVTPVQAMNAYIQQVQVTAQNNARPFRTITELIAGEDSPGDLTAEERNLRDLVNLAVTIRDDDQVNPLTVVEQAAGIDQLYRIETGERRYWAQVLLMEFLPGYGGDGTVPCIVIPETRASVFRQAKENTSRSGLNAVAMARQSALLILAAHDIHPPDYAVDSNFYRQALDLTLRDKRDYTGEILTAMGGISRNRLSQYKSLLALSDEAMELADRYDVENTKLLHVLRLDAAYHADVVRMIIDRNLSKADTARHVDQMLSGKDAPPEAVAALPSAALRLAKSVMKPGIDNPRDLAAALLMEDDNPEIVRARLAQYRALLDEAERYLAT